MPKTNLKKIPIAFPDISSKEKEYVLDAIDSSWISSTGKYLDSFERKFSKVIKTKHTALVSNGTVALHLALMALDLRRGDEVLVPSMTYVATANAVRYMGAEPVFVDIDKKTWCMDPNLIEKSITGKTKGIIAVDLYGHPADMDAINGIASVYGLWVVEDAAEAHMATYKGRPAGSLAKIGTFSFYGNKILTSGEGGALTFNDSSLNVRIRTLKGQGMDPKRRYYFPITGYNFRLTNIAAAFLCAQLERRKEILKKRSEIFKTYKKNLRKVKGIGFQPIASWAKPAPWLYSITIDSNEYGKNRDELMKFLSKKGVETRPFFIPLHTLPPFRRESDARKDYLPITDELGETGLSLPTHTKLSVKDINYICELINKFES